MHLSQSEGQLVQVLTYQRAQHRVEAAGFEGQRSLEVGEYQGYSGVVPPRDVHTAREVDAGGAAPRGS